MPRGKPRQIVRRGRSRSITRLVSLPRRRYPKELASLIEEQIAPWLTEEQKRYIHPCGTSDPFLALGLPMFAVSCSYDNLFQGALSDAYKAYQKWLTGAIAVAFCLIYMFVKIYEFPGPLPVQILKSWIKFPTCPANFRIYRDTAIIVIISYLLLLDINLSYLWLSIFPLIAIGFIYALFHELYYSAKQHGEGVINFGMGYVVTNVESNNIEEMKKEPEELEFIVMMPFCALCALCVMAHIDDRAADRFSISQFLLFLSSTLGVLTRMMIRLPAGASTDVTPASDLLQKSFLLLLLVTVHTVAMEALGEDMLLVCMPEVVPMLLWFSVHLDRDSSIISIDKIKPYKNVLVAPIALVVAPISYLATFMDESWLPICTTIMVACCVSGLLTYYVAFMLHQWPGQQSDVSNNVATNIRIHDTCIPSEKEVVLSKEQEGSSEEVVQLLMFWASGLLITAAGLMLLKYGVARRLGLQEPLVDGLCRNFKVC